MKKISSKQAAYAALILASALLLGLIENAIPPIVPALPFIKIGLSNIAVGFAAVVLGAPYAMLTAVLKSVVVPLMAGNPIMIPYSLTGGVLSAAVTVTLVYSKKLSLPFIGILSAITHNFAQLVVAYAMTSTDAVFAYSPVLLIAAIVAGLATGTVLYILIKYLPEKALKIE